MLGLARKLLIFAALTPSPFALAQEFPASWKFVTQKTPHFSVIVNAEQQELGALFARKLEKSYSVLKTQFTDVPEHTVVVIADKTDITNGYATRLPYSHIFVYPVLPGPQESLGEPGDWLFELVAHEYTHLLTFEAVDGVMEPLQSIFGTILSPNLLLPRWWKEGVAVQIETAASNGGRLRSAYQDGVIRSLEQLNLLSSMDLAQINEILPDWPEGLRPYLFGSLFWSQAVADKGTVVVDRLHQRHGARVPYFVEEPARELLGVSYERFYEKALAETRRRAVQQLETLRAVGFSVTTELMMESQYSQAPAISPDGSRLALIGVSETDRRSVRILKRGETSSTFVDAREEERFTNRREDIVQPDNKDGPPTGTITRVSWFADGRRLVFDKVDAISRYEAYSDLWLFDLDSGKTERLTKGLRAREPWVSRDGVTIYFTGLDGGRTWLGAFDMTTRQSRALWRGPWQERVAFPTELPDGRVVFSVRKPDATESLWVIAKEGGEPTRILVDMPNARLPRATGDALYFTSSRNGVHNIYRTDLQFRQVRPVTHLAGGALAFDLDSRQGDLYVTTLTATGPQVLTIEKSEVERVGNFGPLPAVGPLFADRYPAPAPTPDPETPMTTDEYSPWGYLVPRYWFPIFGLSAVNNSLVLEASTSGFDPLKKHVYALGGTWDSGLNRAGYVATYQNNVFAHSLLVAGARTNSFLVTTDNRVTHDVASVSLLPDLFRLSRYLVGSVGWQWLRTEYTTNPPAERTGPSLILQYADYGRAGLQISPEEGGSLLVGANRYLPGSNRLDYTQYLAGGNYFWSKWLPKRNAVALRFAASYVKEPLAAVYGSQTTNYFYQPDPAGLNFVMRGYRVGHFFGKSLVNAGAEYRFPLREIRRGRGTDPFYFLRVHGALFADAAAVDGFAYMPKQQRFDAVRTDRIFSSFGAEARFETTIGYFLPLNLVLGVAQPSDKEHSDGTNVLLALQMGTLF